MYEDEHLEGDYEDMYTVQADFNAEDDICNDCAEYDDSCTCDEDAEYDEYLEDDISVRMHEYDEMHYPEWMKRPSYAS